MADATYRDALAFVPTERHELVDEPADVSLAEEAPGDTMAHRREASPSRSRYNRRKPSTASTSPPATLTEPEVGDRLAMTPISLYPGVMERSGTYLNQFDSNGK